MAKPNEDRAIDALERIADALEKLADSLVPEFTTQDDSGGTGNGPPDGVGGGG